MQKSSDIAFHPPIPYNTSTDISLKKSQKKGESKVSLTALNSLGQKALQTASPSADQLDNSKQNWVGDLQKNCFELYEKIFLQPETIELISQVSKENYHLARKKGLFKILFMKMIDNALTMDNQTPQILSEASKAIAFYDLPKAVKMTQDIQDDDWKAYALSEMAVDQAKINSPHALLIAQTIPTPMWKAKALAHTAAYMADRDPTQASKVLESSLSQRDFIQDIHYKFEISVLGLHALAKINPHQASQLKDTLVQEAMAFQEEQEEDKLGKVRALCDIAEYLAKDDPTQAQKLAHLAHKIIRQVKTPILHIDGLCSIAKTYGLFNPKKSDKIISDIRSKINSQSHGITAMGANKLMDILPMKKHKLIEDLLKQGLNSSLWIQKKDFQGFVQADILKTQASFYPKLAIQNAKKIRHRYYRALAYCYIAQSLQSYYR